MNAPLATEGFYAGTEPQGEGWGAKLDLQFRKSFLREQPKTILSSIAFDGPLRVQRPFYPEGEVCHVYLLHPPGGVVGGDSLHINLGMSEKSRALLTTPGATKFYRSAGNTCLVNQDLKVEGGACLEWFPHENIFFPGAKAKLQTNIWLGNDSSLFFWEINCLGRPVNNEIFESGKLDSVLKVFLGDVLLLTDRQRVTSIDHLRSAAGLRGYAMQATMLAYEVQPEQLGSVQELLADTVDDLVCGASLVDGLLVVRALGARTEHIHKAFVSVWQLLRPFLNGKDPSLPRIWAT